jgi:hydroxyethylthiazole kinase
MIGIANGDTMLTRVTGTGCSATALIGAFLGAGLAPYDASAAGLAMISIAAELALSHASGPGSFAVALIDALATIDDGIVATRVHFR